MRGSKIPCAQSCISEIIGDIADERRATKRHFDRAVVVQVVVEAQGTVVDKNDPVGLVSEQADGAQFTGSFHWNSKTWTDEIHVVGTEAKVALHPCDGDEAVITVGREIERRKIPEIVEEKRDEVVSLLKKSKVKVPGFRPGKASDLAIRVKLKKRIMLKQQS